VGRAGLSLRLKGNDVPLIARIIAVADTYDAMTSDRAYRRALPHEVAVNEIELCSGSQFDPEVAGIFCAISTSTAKNASRRAKKCRSNEAGALTNRVGGVKHASNMLDDTLREALTFDDVLLLPA